MKSALFAGGLLGIEGAVACYPSEIYEELGVRPFVAPVKPTGARKRVP